jgi:plasmid maintenance system antidote protein VapI
LNILAVRSGETCTIRDLLAYKRLRVCEVAKIIGVSSSSLSLHINGWTSLAVKHHSKLAETLGITVEEVKTNCVKKGRIKWKGN